MPSANSNVVEVTVSTSFALTITPSFYFIVHEFNENSLAFPDQGGAVANYAIYRQINGAGFTLIATTPEPASGYQDSGLASTWVYGQYDYYVEALDSGSRVIATSVTASVVWFNMTSGDNSTGPIPGAGAGEGYFDGATNGMFACGSIAPSTPYLFGAQVSCLGYQQSAHFSDSIVLIAYGTHAQNLFTELQFIDKAANTYTLASSAAYFSTSLIPGFTLWEWSGPLSFPFANGTTYPMMVT